MTQLRETFKDVLQDRDLINDEANEYISYYLYSPDGNLWVNRGKDPDDPYSNPNRADMILARYLPWDPETVVGKNKLGPYNKHWEWVIPRIDRE